MRKYPTILIDGNNLYWRAFITGVKKDKKPSKLVSAGIAEAFSKVKKLLATYGRKDTKVYFLFDNPTHELSIRKVIQPTYKHPRDRKTVPAQLYQTLNAFQQILRVYSDNFYIVVADKKEADDLTAPILAHLQPTPSQPALCVSADLDWARNISKVEGAVEWFNWDRVVSHQSFKKKHGYLPTASAIKLYKSLRGDASDAIAPAVPYLPEEVVLDIVQRFESVEDLLAGLFSQTDYPLQWKQKINNAQSELRVNWRLVDFLPCKESYDRLVVPCKRNPRQARMWFETVGMPVESWMKEKSSAPAFFSERQRVQAKRG